MSDKPRMAKAHSKLVADEYIRLGWTLRHKFYGRGDVEPYEYFFVWEGPGEPVGIDWKEFAARVLK